MALALKGYEMTVVLKDKGLDKSTLRFDLVSSTFEAAITDGAALLADLTAVTQAVVIRRSISEVYEEAAPVFTDAGNVSETAIISARIQSTEDKWATIKIPAPVDGIFSGAAGTVGYNQIDPADAALVAYLENYESSGTAHISDKEHLAETSTVTNIKGWRSTKGGRG